MYRNTINDDSNSIKKDESIPYFLKFGIEREFYQNHKLSDLSISVRTYNCLSKSGILTLYDLLGCDALRLSKIRNLGINCLIEIENTLKNLDEYQENIIINSYNSGYHVPIKFIKSMDELITGNISTLEEKVTNYADKVFIERFKSEAKCIDSFFRNEVVNGNQFVREISRMLGNYSNRITKYYKIYNELNGLVSKLSSDKSEKMILPIFKVFPNSELQSIIENNFYNLKFKDINTISKLVIEYNLKFEQISKLYRKYSIDLNEEFSLYLKKYEKTKEIFIISERAADNTLDSIGNSLNLTRERVRQVEKKIINKANLWFEKNNVIDLAHAYSDYSNIIKIEQITDSISSNKSIFKYMFIKYLNTKPEYKILSGVNSKIIIKTDIENQVKLVIESLPNVFDEFQLRQRFNTFDNINLTYDEVMIIVITIYKKDGNCFHMKSLSLNEMYRFTMKKYFSNGIRIYDDTVIKYFRECLTSEFGKQDLPENNRAISARLADIGILCDRGTYKLKEDIRIDKELFVTIYNYIQSIPRDIILTRSIFNVFSKELIMVGITNHFLLHGLLREFYFNEFFFKKDCIMKNNNDNSICEELNNYIKSSKYPVSLESIRNEFPGATNAIIGRAISMFDIVNLFGKVIHIDNINLSDIEQNFLRENLTELLSDYKPHHVKELYEIIESKNKSFWNKIYVDSTFGAYSISEAFFNECFHFDRPFISNYGVEICDKYQIIKNEANKKDLIKISEIQTLVKDNFLAFTSIYKMIEQLFDSHYLLDKETFIKNELITISEEDIAIIEKLIVSELKEDRTILIRTLPCIPVLPNLNYKWNEWLLFSIIKKHINILEVALTSIYFAKAYPVVSLAGKMDLSKYTEIILEEEYSIVHDFEDIDDLIIEEDYIVF
ncbi:MAG: hypothetical protein BGO41_00925 [Clostridiales bacterium 38-18]|nr:MAG: hypothetical protein BGO41_00925 [Clostridiales bacterium 38-18]